jgi:iron(III) transport system ATP-binding protein
MANSMSELLNVANLTCRYEASTSALPVVDQLSFSLANGEIGCLLGSSGCGKTTILRAIAGFQSIAAGEIRLNNTVISGPRIHLAPEKRRVGMVFQDYALFPHLNVRDNITFGLHKQTRPTKDSICDELLALVKLQGLDHRFPHELSGGQQQRVALARALAPAPQLLLLDEPLSSLDTELRRSLALEVRDILKHQGISAIMVTHDQEEAFAFADKIGVVHQGKLEQWDVPFNLYHQPKTRYVADFIGQGVFIPGCARENLTIDTELGSLRGEHPHNWSDGTPVEVLLRPDDIIEDSGSPYTAQVVHKIFAGTSTLYTLILATGARIEAAFPSHLNFDVGNRIGVRVEADHIISFPREG